MAKKSRKISKRKTESLLDQLLKDFSKLSGIDLTDTPAKTERKRVAPKKKQKQKKRKGRKRGTYEEYDVYEEPTEDQPIDLKNPDGNKTKDYMADLFDYEGVSWDEQIHDEIRDSP